MSSLKQRVQELTGPAPASRPGQAQAPVVDKQLASHGAAEADAPSLFAGGLSPSPAGDVSQIAGPGEKMDVFSHMAASQLLGAGGKTELTAVMPVSNLMKTIFENASLKTSVSPRTLERTPKPLKCTPISTPSSTGGLY
jgi:hypothetical protein